MSEKSETVPVEMLLLKWKGKAKTVSSKKPNRTSDDFEFSEQPRSSAVPAKKLRSKSVPEDAFQRYMRKNYFEHFRRVMSWRRAARWAVFTYPLFSAFLFVFPFTVIALVVRRLYQLQPEWFLNVLSPDSKVMIMPILYGLMIVALIFGLLTGIGLGISRARLLTFEAERTELAVRQSFFLKRIARGRRQSAKRSSQL